MNDGVLIEPEAANSNSQNLDYATRLDVHRWSEHPEVNNFVDQIFRAYFVKGYQHVQRNHLKVVLLDLYVAWSTDPDLKVSYSRNVNDYKAGSIYNELHISRTTINVVDRLEEMGLVAQRKGFNDRKTGVGRIARMWPTEALVAIFRVARFSTFDISYSPDRNPIILRDADGSEVEYSFMPPLQESAEVLHNYNFILKNAYISVPQLTSSQVNTDETNTTFISQSDKFVRRIFNRSSFDLGGRFYGGWWQNCPKSLRQSILINDTPTNELDYSSLHPVILYAQEGIDYWREFGGDPYGIGSVSFQDNSEELRALAKSVLLILLNAENIDTIPMAFRMNAAAGTPNKRLKNDEVFEIVDRLRSKHSAIEAYFHSGVGLSLQNVDSKISERIVEHFIQQSEPILLIHDSYVVRSGWEEELELAMQKSYCEIIGQGYSSHIKYVGLTYEDIENELNARYCFRHGRGTDAEEEEDLALYRQTSPIRSDQYLREWEEFQLWVNQ